MEIIVTNTEEFLSALRGRTNKKINWKNNELKEIYLMGNKITSLNGVKFPDGLERIYLNGNQITSLGGVKFSDGLKVIITLSKRDGNLF